MKLNIPVRWKDLKKYSKDEELERRVLERDDDEIVFTEGPFVIDTNDIRNWNPTDDGGITIRTYQDDAYALEFEFEQWNALWTQITGEVIVEVRVKPIKEKVKRVSK